MLWIPHAVLLWDIDHRWCRCRDDDSSIQILYGDENNVHNGSNKRLVLI